MKMFVTMAALMASTLVGVAEMNNGMQLVREAVSQDQAQLRLIKQMTREAYGMNVEPTASTADSTTTEATPDTTAADTAPADTTAADTTAADNTPTEATYTNPAQDKADADMLALVEQAARMQVIKEMTNGAAGTYAAESNGGQQ